MIPDEQVVRIRHLFHAEHWKIGTIAAELLLHPDTVRRALETDRSTPAGILYSGMPVSMVRASMALIRHSMVSGTVSER